MINIANQQFHLTTEKTSYAFQVTPFGHLQHLYYGVRVQDDHFEASSLKHSITVGSSVAYDQSDLTYLLDQLALEYVGVGKGDYRNNPIEVVMPDGAYVCDFLYHSHHVHEGNLPLNGLPASFGAKETLEVVLKDSVHEVYLHLFYATYEQSDVISRRAVLKNQSESAIEVRKFMSMMVDLPLLNQQLITLDGGWIKEAHQHQRPLQYGLYVNDSKTGASSNRHNPGIVVCDANVQEDYGHAYGFNLVYSGNHYSAVEVSTHDVVRVMNGINPYCFAHPLQPQEHFESPESVMTYSSKGLTPLSQQFHHFVNHHIVRGAYANQPRPVLINNWEANFFDFNERSLLSLAKKAKKLGVELFVLDDGWFGARNSDQAGLGDYDVNRKKLPHGLAGLAKKINALGMDFGLWFEPEMINLKSKLYDLHPDWVVQAPKRTPSMGRNQYVLDLCNPQVRDYIVEQVNHILHSANIKYVKWDMNRHLSDMYSLHVPNQGMFYHTFTLGVYDVFERIVSANPNVLFESCSSGGNRFDLGMLCYTPQIWASDNTDPLSRMRIQSGLSLFYPLSTMGAHVSLAPHQQTLRATPLSTRFNVSAFGLLGYELDLHFLNFKEKEEIKEQIAFYKEQRMLLQYGTFFRFNELRDNQLQWQVVDASQEHSIIGHYQTLAQASPGFDRLQVRGLQEDGHYQLQTKKQKVSIKRFGALINHISPIKLHPEGLLVRVANKYYQLDDASAVYEGSGRLFMQSIGLSHQFMGTGTNDHVRLLGDFGSNLYLIERKQTNE